MVARGGRQRLVEVAGAEAQPEAADVSEETAQKVAMFCVRRVGCDLLREH